MLCQSNKVCVWSYKSPGVVEDGEMSPDIVEPELLCEVETPADVTGLKFLDEMRVAASFTNGCVTLFNFHNKVLQSTPLSSSSSSVLCCA